MSVVGARKRFSWRVKVADETGKVREVGVDAYWSPDHELTTESVVDSACIKALIAAGGKHKFFPVEAPVLVS